MTADASTHKFPHNFIFCVTSFLLKELEKAKIKCYTNSILFIMFYQILTLDGCFNVYKANKITSVTNRNRSLQSSNEDKNKENIFFVLSGVLVFVFLSLFCLFRFEIKRLKVMRKVHFELTAKISQAVQAKKRLRNDRLE